jgi:segregation and condensation protein B
MSLSKMHYILEAAIMSASEPLPLNRLLTLFEGDPEPPDRDQVRKALDELAESYADRGIELKEVASGYRIHVRADYAPWVSRLFEEKPQRYSRALLETLAIIAYRQPITRGEIENIRGVSVSAGIIKTLQEREWVRVVGHRDVPGRPELLATTRQFLDYFNLKSLSDLPPLSEIKDFDQINPDLFEGLEQQEAQQNQEGQAAQEGQEPAEGEGEAADAQADAGAEAEAEETEASAAAEAPDVPAGEEEAQEEEEPAAPGEETREESNVIPFSG